jgi:hypothetical protein
MTLADAFRVHLSELLTKAKQIGVSDEDCEQARLECEDMLSNLFYRVEREQERPVRIERTIGTAPSAY